MDKKIEVESRWAKSPDKDETAKDGFWQMQMVKAALAELAYDDSQYIDLRGKQLTFIVQGDGLHVKAELRTFAHFGKED